MTTRFTAKTASGAVAVPNHGQRSLTSARTPQTRRDMGRARYQAMAPHNTSECAARGLALGVAIDTAGDAHLAFTDAVIALLKEEVKKGHHLGGWFPYASSGPRAIFSPAHSRSRRSTTTSRAFAGCRPLRQVQRRVSGRVRTGPRGPYFGTRGTFFADVSGDGRADAIVVNDDTVTVRRFI